MVLLHALPFDGRMWSEADRAVGEKVIAPDLFGLGDSIVEWASARVAMAGTEELMVVGCSVGGSCALEIARLAPEQVSGIVLVGAKAGVRPDPTLRDESVRVVETHGLAAAWSAYWEPLFGSAALPGVVAAARDLALSHDVTRVANGLRAFHDRRDHTEFVAGWTKPLVVVSGAQDRTPPVSVARSLGEGPQRQFHLVDDCGHYVNLERPHRLRTILADTIAAISGPA